MCSDGGNEGKPCRNSQVGSRSRGCILVDVEDNSDVKRDEGGKQVERRKGRNIDNKSFGEGLF